MPLPLLAWLAIGGAGILGLGAHENAKDTNAAAQRVSRNAQELYDNAKKSLEQAQESTKASLLDLGSKKKEVMEGSMQQFLPLYEKIKNVAIRSSAGLNEIANFSIQEKDVLQLREMVDIYESSFSSGTAGAATGSLIALATTGNLAVVTGALGTAGTALGAAGSALAIGEFGAAAGAVGTALTGLTPLAAILAPAYLFTGISADLKADENLEKAHTMYAEAEAAAEKMKTSETLCIAIAKRADMFNNLLCSLNERFSDCVFLLNRVVNNKKSFFKRKIKDSDLSENEIKLIAVTRSLAGAVKAAIDVPILSEEGELTLDSEKVYNSNVECLPKFDAQLETIDVASIRDNKVTANGHILASVLAVIAAFVATKFAYLFNPYETLMSSAVLTICILFLVSDKEQSRFYSLVNKIASIALIGEFAAFFFYDCSSIINMNYFMLWDILAGLVSVIIMVFCKESQEKSRWPRFCRTLAKITTCFSMLTVGLGISDILSYLNFFSNFCIFAVGCLYILCTLPLLGIKWK